MVGEKYKLINKYSKWLFPPNFFCKPKNPHKTLLFQFIQQQDDKKL